MIPALLKIITVGNSQPMKTIKNANDGLLHDKTKELPKNRTSKVTSQLSKAEMLAVIHNLEANQVELENQNKALREAVRKQQEDETFFKHLIINHNAIMLLVEPDSGSIIDANEAAVAFYGYDKSVLRSMNIAEINTLDPDQIKAERQRAKSEKRNYFVFPHRLANGVIRTVEVHSSPMIFRNHKILFSIIHDITDRKLAEKEINLKNRELSKLITERDKFYSIIAHDLRAPFNGFLGLTEIMAEKLTELTPGEIRRMVTALRSNATNLFRLLGNLLEWSLTQQGLTTLTVVPIQITSKISYSLVLIQDALSRKKIDLDLDIPENLIVVADVNMFETIIRNLLSNAVKFTPAGGKIVVSAKSKADNMVEIAVADQGIGMSPYIVENLFRLDVKTNRKGTNNEPSTGLGLILCKEFIEKQGGKLFVESLEGRGSTFRFTLPAN